MTLNAQFKLSAGQRIATGIEWCDYTANPIGGCAHACRWTMPTGKVAICYAEAMIERFNPGTFAQHKWRPEVLKDFARVNGVRIFIDSASDLFGAQVPADQIQAVLDACAATPYNTYLTLTKNAPRLLRFDFPRNVHVGVSSPPDQMYGKPLSLDQKNAYLSRALQILSSLPPSVITWMSFEPLAYDVADLVAAYPQALNWAVIGAASNGRTNYPPAADHFTRLLAVLDRLAVPVFYKGNLSSLPEASAHWRQDLPDKTGVSA